MKSQLRKFAAMFLSICVALSIMTVASFATEGKTYTKIGTVAELSEGTYLMSAYITADSNGASLEANPYQVFTGSVGSGKLYTSGYAYDATAKTLTIKSGETYEAVAVTLAAVAGQENAYTIYTADKGYLISTDSTANHKLNFSTTNAMTWTASNHTGGGIIFTAENGTVLGTASALSQFIRGYKAGSTTPTGMYFFKEDTASGGTTPTPGDNDQQGGTNTDPAADSTLTIAEAATLGASKAQDTFTENKYYVSGTIKNVASTTWGNMTIEDTDGNTLYLYGLYDQENNRYDAMTTKPVAGDTITVYGVIGNYNGAQMKNAVLTAHIPGEGDGNQGGTNTDPAADSTLTIAEATALGQTKESNVYTDGKYYVSGKITGFYGNNGKTYGNVYITDDAGNSFLVYGMYSADGSTRYDAMETKPVEGDTIKVYGVIGQYNGTSQMKSGWLIEHTPATDGDGNQGGTNTDPAADSTLTIAEAIALGTSKEHNTFTEGKYYITGEITEVYGIQYGNMYIKDADGNTITLYGTYSADGNTRYDAMEVKPVAGDTITVYGIIGQYNNVAQMKNGWIVEHVSGGGSAPVAPEDPKEIVDEAFALETGKSLPYMATLTGKITAIDTPYDETYNNVTVTIEVEGTDETKSLVCYRLKGEGADTIEVGDTITVTGSITNYNGTIEFTSGCTLDKVVVAGTENNNNEDEDNDNNNENNNEDNKNDNDNENNNEEENNNTEAPETGDSSNIMLVALMMLLAGAAFVAASKKRV